MGCGRVDRCRYTGEGDGDVDEDGGGVSVDRGDDDGPRWHSGATRSEGERAPLRLLLP